MIKAKCSCITVDTVAPPPHPDLDVDVCLPAEKITGKICMFPRTFFFSYWLQTFLIAFHSKVWIEVFYGTVLLFQWQVNL